MKSLEVMEMKGRRKGGGVMDELSLAKNGFLIYHCVG
jgi:hypothetical protein